MTSYQEVFERKEVKYRLDAAQHHAMLAALEGRMAVDDYGTTSIVSRYFDTPDRALIERSLDKPLYKEKLRVRSYGIPGEDDQVFVELKKKYQGIVYKRRVGCSYAAARAYMDGMPYEQACCEFPLPDAILAEASLSPRSLQIAREIDAFKERYTPLRASMVTICDRTAMRLSRLAGKVRRRAFPRRCVSPSTRTWHIATCSRKRSSRGLRIGARPSGSACRARFCLLTRRLWK